MVATRGTKPAVEYHLKRFQPAKMETNRVVLMIGKKGSGKSSLLRDIMWFQQNIPCGAVMSATEEANEGYAKMIPPLFLSPEFDADVLESIISRQKRLKALLNAAPDRKLPFDHRAFLIIDDCVYNKQVEPFPVTFDGPNAVIRS